MSDHKIHLVTMPKWGLAMQEGTIVGWHVAEGDRISEGQPLCDIETAKITNEFDSPFSGILARIIKPGDRIMELGGGIGFISALSARNPNTEAVKVFEANPQLIGYIRRLHEINGITNATAENAILLNDPGRRTAEFYLRQDFWASSLSPKPFGYSSVISVPVKSFNAELEAFAPTLIICDIEGGELDLFLNANLSGVSRVYLEIHQGVIGRMGVKRLFDAFSARNFHYDQHHSKAGVVLFSSVRL